MVVAGDDVWVFDGLDRLEVKRAVVGWCLMMFVLMISMSLGT